MTPEQLDARLREARVLWRQPDTLALWAIPYEMRPGQQPYDLWKSTTIEDTLARARGIIGATLPTPGPRDGWIWLGTPGWWGHLTGGQRWVIEAFLEPLREQGLVPLGPCEWTKIGGAQ